MYFIVLSSQLYYVLKNNILSLKKKKGTGFHILQACRPWIDYIAENGLNSWPGCFYLSTAGVTEVQECPFSCPPQT